MNRASGDREVQLHRQDAAYSTIIAMRCELGDVLRESGTPWGFSVTRPIRSRSLRSI